MTKGAIKKVAQEIGDLLDPTLEGTDKWDRFARIHVEINPDKC
jgi:hypothetical protein